MRPVKNSKLFDEILVSTDSAKYGKIADRYGAGVPFLRPEELACEEAATNDVILQVINELKQRGKTFDYFMLLQPASPLRNETHIMESADLILRNNADAVIGVCKTESVSHLTVQLTETGEIKAGFPDKKQVRRQDNPPEYRINGAVYLADIDDEFQLKIAELLLIDQAAVIPPVPL